MSLFSNMIKNLFTVTKSLIYCNLYFRILFDIVGAFTIEPCIFSYWKWYFFEYKYEIQKKKVWDSSMWHVVTQVFVFIILLMFDCVVIKIWISFDELDQWNKYQIKLSLYFYEIWSWYKIFKFVKFYLYLEYKILNYKFSVVLVLLSSLSCFRLKKKSY